MLSDAERERYGRVAAEAYFNGVAPFATELWDAFNDIDTREWFLRSAEAVIDAYVQDQQARQAAMEHKLIAIEQALIPISGEDGVIRYQATDDIMDLIDDALAALNATTQEASDAQ